MSVLTFVTPGESTQELKYAMRGFGFIIFCFTRVTHTGDYKCNLSFRPSPPPKQRSIGLVAKALGCITIQDDSDAVFVPWRARPRRGVRRGQPGFDERQPRDGDTAIALSGPVEPGADPGKAKRMGWQRQQEGGMRGLGKRLGRRGWKVRVRV